MRTQVNKKGLLAFCLMLASIALVAFMLQMQSKPAEEKAESVAPEAAAANVVLPVSAEELYSRAEKYSGSGDYLGALKALAEIDETWPQYPQAAALTKECEEKLLAEVSSPTTVEEYLNCEKKVNDYLEVRASPAFLERKKELVRDRDAFIAAALIIEKATDEFERGDYSAAFETLSKDERGSTDNRFLIEKLDEFHNIFVGEVVQEIEGEVRSENYREALRIVEDAIEVYDCEELQSARQQVLEAIDPLYGVYNDMRDTLSDWYEYWTEDTEEMDQLFGITW